MSLESFFSNILYQLVRMSVKSPDYQYDEPNFILLLKLLLHFSDVFDENKVR